MKNAAVWIAGTLGLGLLAAAAWWVGTEDSPAEEIEVEIAFPSAQPPDERPLVAPSGSGIGWTWVNPLPRAMPSWFAAAAMGPSNVAIVGEAGAVIRYDAAGLSVWQSGTEEALRGAAWLTDRTLIVVGTNGTLRLLRGPADAQALPSPASVDLNAVAVDKNGNAHIVGDEGTWLVIDAGSHDVRQVATESEENFFDVAIHDGNIYISGGAGTLLRRASASSENEEPEIQSLATGTGSALRTVGGCNESSLYAAGDRGLLLRMTARGEFESIRLSTPADLTDIGCDGTRAVAVGRGGTVLLIANSRTMRLETGTDRALFAVDGSGPTWVVGERGRLYTVTEGQVRGLTAGPTHPFRALGDIAGALVAVGDWGVVARETETGFSVVETPTDAGLADVAPEGRANLVAVGDEGTILRVTPTQTEVIPSPVQSSFRGISGEAGNFVIVGTGGALVSGRVDGTTELTARRLGEQDLWDVVGNPDASVAVGNEGTVLRIGPAEATRARCDTEQDLLAVARLPSGLWAVGRQGVIVRIPERGPCTIERTAREGDPDLYGIGPGPEGTPMAVGDGGTALVMRDGRFQRANLNVAGTNLYAIYQGRRSVYLAGAGGVLVRHVRLDGGP